MILEKEYEVTVVETFSKTIKIRARSKHDASKKVCELYRQREIVLNDDDYIATEFSIDGEML